MIVTQLQQPCGALRKHPAAPVLSEIGHRALATVRRWRRRIRERAQLAAMDERMLRDIGITRLDAQYLSSKPFWRE